ncbi:putative disease resistance protein RGA4 [Rosa chinensis]|uniref:putative disease resistance protein RGA4 n=1 Tax=Rosa chinensis TaxID=74649 RepID=UPI001AD8FBA5|nr:putative disease resistance protein RGA4 [Rosa chinensis]
MAELALVNLLLKELFTVAFDQTKEAVTLVLTAKAEVEKFSSNLKAIQAVLQDAEKQQVEKASVRNWLDQLNDVSYEMVDVLDEWNTEILKQKAKGVATEKKKTFKKDVVEEIHSWDKSITTFCKMHDIVHDFVQFLNKNEYFTIEAKKANAGMMIISEEVRHLSLRYVRRSPLLDFLSPVNCKKLRTLATFDSRMSRIDMKAISQLRCLRTLNLSYSYIQELPEEIGELIHLRYLDLTNNVKLTKLPDSLGNLYNLQTLCLSRCWWIKALPENMGNLINLRHLHTKHCELLEYLPRGVARLISLQTLDVCPVNDEGLKLGDLGSLDQLQGTLLINIKGNLKDTSEAQKACLWNKKLYYLELSFSRLEEQSHVQVQVLEALRPHQDLETLNIISYGGTTAPSWMISLQNLRSLSLHTWDGCEFLPPLGKMPFLEQLSVTRLEKVKTVGDEFLGTQTSSSFVLFPKLKELTFDRMEEWEQWEGVGGWTESGGADESTIMPCLVSFTIKDCPKLKNLPLFLQDTQVRKISISKCRRSIITPVWPDNCDVDISEELEDPEIPNTTESRVETEIQIDEEIQSDEETTMSPETAKLEDCCNYVLRGGWIVLPQKAAAGLWRFVKSYRLR